MRVGDKLYCYKALEPYFYIGNYYYITEVNSISIHVRVREIRKDYSSVWAFSLLDNDGYSLFSEYFYDMKEYRKLKLNKLNEKRR